MGTAAWFRIALWRAQMNDPKVIVLSNRFTLAYQVLCLALIAAGAGLVVFTLLTRPLRDERVLLALSALIVLTLYAALPLGWRRVTLAGDSVIARGLFRRDVIPVRSIRTVEENRWVGMHPHRKVIVRWAADGDDILDVRYRAPNDVEGTFRLHPPPHWGTRLLRGAKASQGG